ncbi:MAG: Gfo/Idh/MocA family oxidoreductase [Micromonosporaceae bacterium]|nr:Gfo/Idh/MocA family oxidoreductase [Micromonosporaceae bacterium]
MRTAIIGYGLAGRIFHGRLLASTPGVEVVAVVTQSPERRAQVHEDFPGTPCFDGVPTMLQTTQPELAVVASATAAHAGDALSCVTAGVPVVVDKPLAPTAAQAATVVEAARAAGVPLTVFQNRRYDADMLTLHRLLATGELGRVTRFESRFERWRPVPDLTRWRERADPAQGAGVLLDLGSHLVDQACLLLGPVGAVYAEVDARRSAPRDGTPGPASGADDDVFLALRHTGGGYSHLWCGSVTAAAGPRLRVLGTTGALVVEELDGQEAALRDGRSPAAAAAQTMNLVRGAQREAVRPEPGGWDRFYPEVLAALGAGTPMPVDPEDAVRVLRILDAARVSARENRLVAPG